MTALNYSSILDRHRIIIILINFFFYIFPVALAMDQATSMSLGHYNLAEPFMSLAFLLANYRYRGTHFVGVRIFRGLSNLKLQLVIVDLL